MPPVALLLGVLLSLPLQAADPVSVTGGLGAVHAWNKKPVSLWLHVANNRADDITPVVVRLLGGEADLTEVCWTAPDDPTRCESKAPVIPPAGVRMMRATMVSHTSGDWRPYLLVDWKSAAASGMHAVPLGSLVVEGYWWSWAKEIAEWLKNIALPLALGLIGYTYQQRLEREKESVRQENERERDAFHKREERERDEARKQEERERENARKQERDLETARLDHQRELAKMEEAKEREMAERAATLRIMLPKIHEYATKYYATLGMRSGNFLQAVRDYRPPVPAGSAGTRALDDPALDEVTYWAVSLYHAHRLLIREVGAYYLKDRMGEELVVGAVTCVTKSLFPGRAASDVAITHVLDSLTAQLLLPFGTFQEHLKASTDNVRAQHGILRDRVSAWIASPGRAEALASLALFKDVLEFEMNRPYENWYGSPEWLKLDAVELGAVDAIVKERPQYAEQIGAYIKRSSGTSP
jgi:hypothetical protein